MVDLELDQRGARYQSDCWSGLMEVAKARLEAPAWMRERRGRASEVEETEEHELYQLDEAQARGREGVEMKKKTKR